MAAQEIFMLEVYLTANVKVKERCVRHKEILTGLLTKVPGIMIKEQIGHIWGF